MRSPRVLRSERRAAMAVSPPACRQVRTARNMHDQMMRLNSTPPMSGQFNFVSSMIFPSSSAAPSGSACPGWTVFRSCSLPGRYGAITVCVAADGNAASPSCPPAISMSKDRARFQPPRGRTRWIWKLPSSKGLCALSGSVDRIPLSAFLTESPETGKGT